MPSIATTHQIKSTYVINDADLLWTSFGDTVGQPVGYYIEGTAAADELHGSELADTIHGLAGDDQLYGQDGNDHLLGDQGDDTLHGGAGADVLDGGEGWDWVSYFGSTGVTVDLRDRGFGGQAEGDTYVGIENVFGSTFSDVLLGNAESNRLSGWSGSDHLFGDYGNDWLNGDAGNDRIDGGVGNDIIDGGTGNDVLTGGEGVDKFILRPSSGTDTFLDFEAGVDVIMLDVRGRHMDPANTDVFDDPFGLDGQFAVGYFRGDGTFSGTGLDAADDVIYLTNTNQLIDVDTMSAVNGHWTVHGTVLATLNVDITQNDIFLL